MAQVISDREEVIDRLPRVTRYVYERIVLLDYQLFRPPHKLTDRMKVEIAVAHQQPEANVAGKILGQYEPNLLRILFSISIQSIHKVVVHQLLPVSREE
jgi:hypothetical protein